MVHSSGGSYSFVNGGQEQLVWPSRMKKSTLWLIGKNNNFVNEGMRKGTFCERMLRKQFFVTLNVDIEMLLLQYWKENLLSNYCYWKTLQLKTFLLKTLLFENATIADVVNSVSVLLFPYTQSSLTHHLVLFSSQLIFVFWLYDYLFRIITSSVTTHSRHIFTYLVLWLVQMIKLVRLWHLVLWLIWYLFLRLVHFIPCIYQWHIVLRLMYMIKIVQLWHLVCDWYGTYSYR